jgi:inhibitor of cysteine peptidase
MRRTGFSNTLRGRPLTSRRQLLRGGACAAAVTLLQPAAQAQQVIRLAPGQARSVTFSENPSTGYLWAIDPAASRGLDIVAVTDHGHRPGGTMPGAPGERIWTVRALTPGRADIVFVCRRSWESAPAETRRVMVEVGR